MKTLSKDTFLQRFKSRRIELDTRYNPPQTLTFTGSDHRWSCEMPTRIKDIPRWVTALIDLTDPRESVYLYPRKGGWRSGESLQLFQMSAVLSTCRITPTGDEVLHANIAERDAIDTLFFLSLLHGWTVSDDLFLIPDHGEVILYADHHEAVHALFANEAVMSRYILRIAEFI